VVEGARVPSDLTLRVKSLESLLVEKGLVDPAALDALIDTMEHKVGPRNGARVVARAWMDPAYKQRLLENAPAAIAELGYTSGQGEHTLVVENSAKVHTWSCARCALVIHGRFSACLPFGTSPRRIALARSSTRAASCVSSARSCRTMSKCASGTAPRSCAIWFCPSVRLVLN